MFRLMKQCPFLLRLCQEVLLRATRWFFFFSCFLCRKRKVNAESVSLPHKWNKRPHTAGNPGRMIVATRLDKSRRIGKQSYSLCCGLPFSRFRWCLFPFGDSFFTDFPLKFFLPNLPLVSFTSILRLSVSRWKSHTNLTHPGKYFRPSKVKIMRPTSPK